VSVDSLNRIAFKSSPARSIGKNLSVEECLKIGLTTKLNAVLLAGLMIMN